MAEYFFRESDPAAASVHPGRASGVTRKYSSAARNRTAEKTRAVGFSVMVSASAESPRTRCCKPALPAEKDCRRPVFLSAGYRLPAFPADRACSRTARARRTSRTAITWNRAVTMSVFAESAIFMTPGVQAMSSAAVSPARGPKIPRTASPARNRRNTAHHRLKQSTKP